jgi:hypothetical protein
LAVKILGRKISGSEKEERGTVARARKRERQPGTDNSDGGAEKKLGPLDDQSFAQ